MTEPSRIATVGDLGRDRSINQEFVERWLSAFRATPGAESMTDFSLTALQQVVANDADALLDERNLIIAGPTSAGKTMAAEILMARLQTAARPPYGCVYAVPLRALATEKWQRFKAIFGEEDVYVSSGDYQDQDARILSRRFRIAVVVYEKLYGWWLQKNTHDTILHNMGMLIVDELQMLGDIQRGPRLELLLTFVRQLQLRRPGMRRLRLIGLGPRPEALAPIAEWLDAKMLATADNERPVPLAEGFICPGRPAQFVGSDPRIQQLKIVVPEVRSVTREGMLKDIVSGLLKRDGRMLEVGRGKRILVYSATKDGAERLATSLADVLGLRQQFDQTTSEALEALERTHATARLRRTMSAGVAFHHGDLTFGERGMVERLFRAEPPATCLDVVICTPTLAMGVNLPADYMLFASSDSFKPKDWDERGNFLTPLSPLEYHNFAGRAGRYRPNAPPDHHGVALFISERNEDETRREIVDPIIRGRISAVASEMHRWPFGLEPLALAASYSVQIESRLPPTAAELTHLFLTTYFGRTAKLKAPDGDDQMLPLVGDVVPTLQALARQHGELLDSSFAVNLTGNVVARAGIHIKTYEVLSEIAAHVNEGILETPLVILEHLAVVPEILKLYPTGLSDQPREQAKITRALRAFLKEMHAAGNTLGPRAAKLIEHAYVPDRSTLEVLMRVAASWLWIEGCSAEKLSAQEMLPSLRYGACNLLGDQLHWLVSTLPDLWDALGFSKQTDEETEVSKQIDEETAAEKRWQLGRLERRLRFGVPDSLVGIAQLRVPGLHRENMMALWQRVAVVRRRERGWDHPVELLDVPPKSMGEFKKLFQSLQRAILKRAWSDDPRPAWAKQIDVARLAADNEGEKYVDPAWADLLRSLWTEDDPQKLGSTLARALVLKPIRLKVKEQATAAGTKYFILEPGRTILLAAVGDGATVQWDQVRQLSGIEGPYGPPVDGVLVLANGNISGIKEPHSAYGQPIRVLTKEALGHFIVQALVSPEEGELESASGPKPIVQLVRDWLCADTGNILETAKDADAALADRGLDQSNRDARWFQGRSVSRQMLAPVEDVRERDARRVKLEVLRKDVERLLSVEGDHGDTFLERLVEDFEREVERLENEPTMVAGNVRIRIEELIRLSFQDYGIREGSDKAENLLDRVRREAGLSENWPRYMTSLRTLSNAAHHVGPTRDSDGRFRTEYSFSEAYETLATTVRLWREYLEHRPTQPLTQPQAQP